MANFRDGFKFAQGLAGLLSGIVLAGVAIVVGIGTALGVGGGGIWNAVLLFAILLAIVSPLWYWVVRPIYIWKFDERDAPWYRPPGTLSSNRVVRYGSIGGYAIVVGFVLLIFGALIFSGGPTQLEIGEEGSTDKLTASVTEYETTDRLVEQGRLSDEERTATSGATFVLVRFELTNSGESQVEPPGNSILGTKIVMVYKDSNVEPLNVDNFTVSGDSYVSYFEVVDEHDGTIFPGTTVSGWIVFELPEGFEESDAVVRIEMKPDSQVFEWTLG